MRCGRQRRLHLSRKMRQQLLRAQKNEITEYHIYSHLANRVRGRKNRQVLRQIADEERKHCRFWQEYTGKEVEAGSFKIWFTLLMAKLFGFTFAVKLMEQGEGRAQVNYAEIGKEIPEAKQVEAEENAHENKLLAMLDEARLKYVGSMVLGLNDALVELTGALAGLTLALQNGRLIAVTGLITGIAASLSMGTSEYLSTKAESKDKDPLKASVYTGVMYILTVTLLILPYFLISNLFWALGTTLSVAVLIVLGFNFYISIAQNLDFKKRFLEMAGLSLGVSAITFIIGYIVRTVFGFEV